MNQQLLITVNQWQIGLDSGFLKRVDLDLDLDLKIGLDLDLDLNIAGFAHHCCRLQVCSLFCVEASLKRC